MSAPANHGQSSHGLRGDYSRMRPDHTVEQDHAAYTEAEHDRWRRLYHRQIELVPGRACEEYASALRSLDYEGGIPRFETVNRQLGAATGWQCRPGGDQCDQPRRRGGHAGLGVHLCGGDDHQQRFTRVAVGGAVLVVRAPALAAFLVDGESHRTALWYLSTTRSSQFGISFGSGGVTASTSALCNANTLCGR